MVFIKYLRTHKRGHMNFSNDVRQRQITAKIGDTLQYIVKFRDKNRSQFGDI